MLSPLKNSDRDIQTAIPMKNNPSGSFHSPAGDLEIPHALVKKKAGRPPGTKNKADAKKPGPKKQAEDI